nr:DUF4190 domain-containing protein [Planosporangium flavigriseum]
MTALTLGIIGLMGFICTFGVPSLLAVVFGHAARYEIRRSGKAGDHFAKTGLWLGYPIVALWIVFFIAQAAGVKP